MNHLEALNTRQTIFYNALDLTTGNFFEVELAPFDLYQSAPSP